MCGIVGYTGPRSCVEILVDGLRRLEYRGYDSAGVAIQAGGEILHVAHDEGFDLLVVLVLRRESNDAQRVLK